MMVKSIGADYVIDYKTEVELLHIHFLALFLVYLEKDCFCWLQRYASIV